MEQHQELFLDVPEIPQCLLGDGERAQMHHDLEEAEIRRRIARTIEDRQLKARLEAGEIHRGTVQGFGEIGEGVHGVD